MAIPEGGMQSLIDALIRKLQTYSHVSLHLNARVESLNTLPEGDLALCVPAGQASKLLAYSCPESSALLAGVAYAPLISVTVVAYNEQFESLPHGTGLLVPPSEQRDILGVLFCSSSFPAISSDSNRVVLRVMLGGSSRPELLKLAEDEIGELVARQLRQLFGFRPLATDVMRCYYWPQAIPIYSPELLSCWDALPWIRTPGRVLFGNYTGKVSVRGMIEQTFHLGRPV
jgi:protoporphyrinogen oxidase